MRRQISSIASALWAEYQTRILLKNCETIDNSHCSMGASLSHFELPILTTPISFASRRRSSQRLSSHVHRCGALVNIFGFTSVSIFDQHRLQLVRYRVNEWFRDDKIANEDNPGRGRFSMWRRISVLCVCVCAACDISILWTMFSCAPLLLFLCGIVAAVSNRTVTGGDEVSRTASSSRRTCSWTGPPWRARTPI